MWKFCGKAYFYYKIFQTRKLGEITVFFGVNSRVIDWVTLNMNMAKYLLKILREFLFKNGYLNKRKLELKLFCLFLRSFYFHIIITASKASVFGDFVVRIFPQSYFPTTTEICRVSHHIQSKCGKIRTRKNANTDTFYAVISQKEKLTNFRLFHFCDSWKQQNTRTFLTFSEGSTEMKHY